jgi:hypothetical protein
MMTRIRWALASWIAPDMAPKAPELRSCLMQIYQWTDYKDTPWARRTAKALGVDGKAWW